MRTEPVAPASIDRAVAVAVGLLATGCMSCMAVINHYYPYSPLDDTLVKTPQYINELNDVLGFLVMLGLPFVLLLVLVNAGLVLAKEFTFRKLLLNLISLVAVVAALLYCGRLFLDGFD